MAKNLLKLKYKAHQAFDLIWMHGFLTRNEAYSWLSRQLKVSDGSAHISTMTEPELKWLIRRAPRYYAKLQKRQRPKGSSLNRFKRRTLYDSHAKQ